VAALGWYAERKKSTTSDLANTIKPRAATEGRPYSTFRVALLTRVALLNL